MGCRKPAVDRGLVCFGVPAAMAGAGEVGAVADVAATPVYRRRARKPLELFEYEYVQPMLAQ